ncbi:MAG: S1C family serine protease [Anaerolineae bacterium]
MTLGQPDGSGGGVSPAIAALIALIALAAGFAAGLALGGAAGLLIGRRVAPEVSLRGSDLAPLRVERQRLEDEINSLRRDLDDARARLQGQGEGEGGSGGGAEKEGGAGPLQGAPTIDQPFLGVNARDYDPETDPPAGDADAGAFVSGVLPDTGAAEAGIEEGDVIVAVDDTDIAGVDSLIAALAREDVGTTVTLTIIRDGERREVEAKLGPRPLTTTPLLEGQLPEIMPFDPSDPRMKEFLDQLGPEVRKFFDQPPPTAAPES